MKKTVKAHFVTFYSPGTFVAEQSEHSIDSWDVDRAIALAKDIRERYNARPYGFRFTTRTRGAKDLDSKVTATSGLYWLGGVVETLAQVKARATEKERILVSNMECNGYKKIVTNTNSWKWTMPLEDGDVVLDVTLGEPPSVGAVDPPAGSTGKTSTRDANSSHRAAAVARSAPPTPEEQS